MVNRIEARKKRVQLEGSDISKISPKELGSAGNYEENSSLDIREQLEATNLILQETRECYVGNDHENMSAFGNIMRVLGLRNKERPDNAKNSLYYQKYKRIWNEFLDLNIQICKNKHVDSGAISLKKEMVALVAYLKTKENLTLVDLRTTERMKRLGKATIDLHDKLNLTVGIALPEIFQQKKKKVRVAKSSPAVKLTEDIPEEKEEGIWHMLERLGGSELVDLISEAKSSSEEDFNQAYRKIFHRIIKSIHGEHTGDLKELGELDAREYISAGRIENSKIELLAEFAKKHLKDGFMEVRDGENMKEWMARIAGMLILKLCEDQFESVNNQAEV